jgi:hypothetical protein
MVLRALAQPILFFGFLGVLAPLRDALILVLGFLLKQLPE